MRDVLLGADPSVDISRRGISGLAHLRDELAGTVDESGLVLRTEKGRSRWWTWGGTRANATLAAALEEQGANVAYDHAHVTVAERLGVAEIRRVAERLDATPPVVDAAALEGLKFSAALPLTLAKATLAARLGDGGGAKVVAGEPLVLVKGPAPE